MRDRKWSSSTRKKHRFHKGFYEIRFFARARAPVDAKTLCASSPRNACCAKPDGFCTRVYAPLSGVGVFFIALVYSECSARRFAAALFRHRHISWLGGQQWRRREKRRRRRRLVRRSSLTSTFTLKVSSYGSV